MTRESIIRVESEPWEREESTYSDGRPRPTEWERDVFTASEDSPYDGRAFTIAGSGESKGGPYDRQDWTWGIGTGLRVHKESIPALMKVLATLMEYEGEDAR